jgi:hypothetical protein
MRKHRKLARLDSRASPAAAITADTGGGDRGNHS